MRRVAAMLLLAALSWPAPVLSQSSGSASREVTWTLTALAGSDPIRLQGYRPRLTLELVLPAGWSPEGAGRLSLEYRISELAFAGSTLTARLNELTIRSTLFPDRSGSLSFEIPARLFEPGSNSLELEALLPLESDTESSVVENPARWLELGAGSQVRLSVRSREAPLTLADFPAQFEALGDDSHAELTFVVPDEADDNELSAIAAVAFALQRGSMTHPRWSVISQAGFDPGAMGGPAILIGRAGSIGLLDRLAPSSPGGSGWLRLARPDWSGEEIVLGIGGTDSLGVRQAAEALLDPVALLKMSSDVATIGGQPDRTPRALAEEVTLADLGYGSRMVRGVGEHSLIYSFDLPFEWSPADATLLTHLAHGALLDPNVATLTILVNGSTAFDVRLDAPQTVPHRMEMTLPHGLLRPGRNYLRMSFDLGSSAGWGSVESQEKPWATIRPDTTLSVPHTRQGGRMNLADFPELFASEVDLAALSLVLPARSTEADLAEAVRLVRMLSLPGNQSLFAPRLMRAESAAAPHLRTHLVLLGEWQRQPVLGELNNYLLARFDPETGALERSYGIRVPTGEPDLGIVELLRSPWHRNRVILAVSGTSALGYEAAMELLVTPELARRLRGDLAVVSRGSELGAPVVYSQSAADAGAVPGVGAVDRLLGRFLDADGPGPTLFLLALVLVSLGASAALVRYRRGTQAAEERGAKEEE